MTTPNVRRIMPLIRKKIVTFGFAAGADLRAVKVRTSGFASRYELVTPAGSLGAVRPERRRPAQRGQFAGGHRRRPGSGRRPGHHPLRLAQFTLPERRFQVLYSSPGLLVIDDYAHHPSEIKATLKTLRSSRRRRVVAVFQPHRFTRLQLLMKQFAAAFRSADVLVIAKLYTANQDEIAGVNSQALADAIRDRGQQHVHYLESFAEISEFLKGELRAGDSLAFLSAGNLTRLAHDFAAEMEALKK